MRLPRLKRSGGKAPSWTRASSSRLRGLRTGTPPDRGLPGGVRACCKIPQPTIAARTRRDTTRRRVGSNEGTRVINGFEDRNSLIRIRLGNQKGRRAGQTPGPELQPGFPFPPRPRHSRIRQEGGLRTATPSASSIRPLGGPVPPTAA